MKKYITNEPRGADLLATLVRLYSEQEGLRVTYETERAVSA